MKDVLFYDQESAESEIFTVRRTARGLDALIKFIKKYLPEYKPNIQSLEKLFRERNVPGRIFEIIRSESKQGLSFDDPNPPDDLIGRSKFIDGIAGLVSKIQRGDWTHWYSVDESDSIAIKQFYTREIKEKHNRKLQGAKLKAYYQANKLVKMLNESQELVANGRVLIPGIVSKNNGVRDVYELNSEYFLNLSKG